MTPSRGHTARRYCNWPGLTTRCVLSSGRRAHAEPIAPRDRAASAAAVAARLPRTPRPTRVLDPPLLAPGGSASPHRKLAYIKINTELPHVGGVIVGRVEPDAGAVGLDPELQTHDLLLEPPLGSRDSPGHAVPLLRRSGLVDPGVGPTGRPSGRWDLAQDRSIRTAKCKLHDKYRLIVLAEPAQDQPDKVVDFAIARHPRHDAPWMCAGTTMPSCRCARPPCSRKHCSSVTPRIIDARTVTSTGDPGAITRLRHRSKHALVGKRGAPRTRPNPSTITSD